MKTAFRRRESAILFTILASFFVANVFIAEFIGVKIFSLEKLLDISEMQFVIFGETISGINLTAGVLLWPVVFIMTDVINEYFGKKGVRFLSILAAVLIVYAFVMFFLGIELPAAGFWPTSHEMNEDYTEDEIAAIGDLNIAFKMIFGQGLGIIIGSLVAFLIGQLLDAVVFEKLKIWTKGKKIWLRAHGSTLISQLVDSYVVLFIAFYLYADWPLALVLAIGTVNYIYKFIMAIVLTPALYGAHFVIDKFLGDKLAAKLRREAVGL